MPLNEVHIELCNDAGAVIQVFQGYQIVLIQIYGGAPQNFVNLNVPKHCFDS